MEETAKMDRIWGVSNNNWDSILVKGNEINELATKTGGYHQNLWNSS